MGNCQELACASNTRGITRPACSLFIEEQRGRERVNEPVTVGIPFPKRAFFHPAELRLRDHHDRPCPLQVEILARWSDNSIKWALLDFQASVRAKERVHYQLQFVQKPETPEQYQGVIVQQAADTVVVNTDSSTFFVNPQVCQPFARVVVHEREILADAGSHIVLIDQEGTEHQPWIRNVALEAAGPLRVTLKIEGDFYTAKQAAFAVFLARLSFYAQSSIVELKFTLRNPRAAQHPGGLWDLGDKGSVYFRDLAIHLPLRAVDDQTVVWKAGLSQPVRCSENAKVEIYQDSSGGSNWQSANHVNRFGRVTTTFRGYRVTENGTVTEAGDRATPIVSIQTPKRSLSGTVVGFWQNFPKALEALPDQLSIHLFPPQYSDVHELQGGEQKTHTVFFHFAKEKDCSLEWVHDRVMPQVTPEWFAGSRVLPYLTPRTQQDEESLTAADRLVDRAVKGTHTFFDRREIIDEYGWRHFGDLYADHEAIGQQGERPLIAHYNNQYDVLYGAIVQHARSGDTLWFHLARDLAQHVIDIDIYHTQEDRSAFNGGLFWHTEHYTNAATATHRAYSQANIGNRNPLLCGGGPSNEHNYTSGLLHYYYLTGDSTAKEVVLGLANWVIHLDDGSKSRFALFDKRPTGLCSATVSRDYHGPGRGCGNSMNALLDASILTRDPKYLDKAEQLIRRCIHPKDNIQARNLSDIEHRWSYTVFLQVLGKYLDLKAEAGAVDDMYSYAQASLLHYAQWMVENEVPYKQVLDKVEIPTETWPAQDIRKSNVFKFAAKHAEEPLRSTFLQKSEFFFKTCMTDLLSFPTCELTRPVVLLMTNAFMHAYFQIHPEEQAPRPQSSGDFGQPQQFTPQLYELYQMKEKLVMVMEKVRDAGRRITGYVRVGNITLGGDRG